MFVVEQLTPTLAKESTKFRATIPVSKRVMITVYKLTTTYEFRTISNLFGVGRSTACVLFHDVCRAIKEVLTPQYIVFPRDTQL